MKMKRLKHLRPVALTALGLFLGRGAQAETILDFESIPPGQTSNQPILQTFGDNAVASSEGVTVVGFGTPNIGLTWQATGGRWDYYNDGGFLWSAVQLDSSNVGDRHEIVFTPNAEQVSVVIKSFNFHPYYMSSERFTYDVSVVAGSTVVSGPSNITFRSESVKVPVSINYTGSPNQSLILRLDRVASVLEEGETVGGSGNIAIDDITFAQLPEIEFAVGPQVLSTIPANSQISVAPDRLYRATLTNLTYAVVPGSIQLSLNGAPVAPPPVITQNGGLTTVSYESAALLPSGSTNRYTLTYSDNAVPPKSYTNQVQFIVAAYTDLQLPPPIHFENFDNTPEGTLPPGWTSVSLDTLRDFSSEPEFTMTNLDSAAYTNWTVVDVSRFTGTFDVYSRFYNFNPPPAGWTEDYQRVLSVNPSNVVNGVFLRNLASGRMVFGNSGYRNDSLGQVLYLFSPDFDLTGKTDVHLAFHSLWEQNQDSIAAVEYSIDEGLTWLPIVYMLDSSDVVTNLDGSIDALTTFTNEYIGGFQGVATYVDPDTFAIVGGYYGAFIGVDSNQWSTLGPYISRRVDDNPIESKRVEVFRLPQADNQPKVRLRFAHAGTDSWYFGVDNVGFYSLASAPLQISSIVRVGQNVTVAWPGAPGLRLQKSTSLANPNWGNIEGTEGSSSHTEAISGPEVYFRLAR